MQKQIKKDEMPPQAAISDAVNPGAEAEGSDEESRLDALEKAVFRILELVEGQFGAKPDVPEAAPAPVEEMKSTKPVVKEDEKSPEDKKEDAKEEEKDKKKAEIDEKPKEPAKEKEPMGEDVKPKDKDKPEVEKAWDLKKMVDERLAVELKKMQKVSTPRSKHSDPSAPASKEKTDLAMSFINKAKEGKITIADMRRQSEEFIQKAYDDKIEGIIKTEVPQ